jgi:outer membrane protein assembly factor BamD (BamD/ComL family)
MPSAPVTKVGPAPAALAPPAEPSAPPSRSARGTTREDPFTAELELLQRAHAAYTHRDFSVALKLVGEHARRFPKGHLAEQREALRVQSLAGAGRTDEAHRAAAAFAIQFPRSVLLSRMRPGSDSAGP